MPNEIEPLRDDEFAAAEKEDDYGGRGYLLDRAIARIRADAEKIKLYSAVIPDHWLERMRRGDITIHATLEDRT